MKRRKERNERKRKIEGKYIMKKGIEKDKKRNNERKSSK